MILLYKAIQSTMATKAGDKRRYLNLAKIGRTVSTQQLTEMIAEKSSLTPDDIRNVIRNLMTAIRSKLLDGKTVYLEGLDTLTVRARNRGRGVDKEGDTNPNQVGALLCHFTPGYTRSAAIGAAHVLPQGVGFQKISSIGTSGGNGSGDDDGDIADSLTI